MISREDIPLGLGMTKRINSVTSAKAVIKIEAISFAKYKKGCLAIGYVLNVSNDKAIVSLPGGVTGVVQYNEISDVINRMVIERDQYSDKKMKNKVIMTMIFIT